MSSTRFFAALLLLAPVVSPLSANDWPSWRGPNGDGTLVRGSDTPAYPLEWGPDRNLRWKTELPAPGNSSPIVVGGRVFVTLGEDQGRVRSLLCFRADDGELLWKKSVNHGKREPTHKTNPWCSASPVSDGERVYAWFGNAGLHAYDLEGKEVWKRDLGDDYAHIWGPNAASPVLHGDLLLLHAGPGLAVRLFGLRREDGTTVWEKDLPGATSEKADQFKGSWATPLVIDNRGRAEMLIGLPGALRSFDPATGEEWWRCEGLGDLCYTSTLADGEHAVYLGGFGGPGLGLSLPPPGTTGDITRAHRKWADRGKKPNRQRIGSGQILDGHLFQLDAPGVMVCLELASGRKVYEERLGRSSWSSLNLVDGRFYVCDQSGTTFVIEPDPKQLEVLHENPVDPRQHTNATHAFADGVVYQRTDEFLYAFGE